MLHLSASILRGQPITSDSRAAAPVWSSARDWQTVAACSPQDIPLAGSRLRQSIGKGIGNSGGCSIGNSGGCSISGGRHCARWLAFQCWPAAFPCSSAAASRVRPIPPVGELARLFIHEPRGVGARAARASRPESNRNESKPSRPMLPLLLLICWRAASNTATCRS